MTNEAAALLSHIRAVNARIGTAYSEDVADWAQYGVRTVDDFDRSCLYSAISDAHKDAYGFRCRFDWRECSLAELQAEYDSICAHAEMEAQWEQEAQERAQKLADADAVRICQNLGIDRATYDRWMSAA